jgi:hypothetical protein
MWLLSWLRTRTANRAARGRAQDRSAAVRFRPQVEALEGRTLPSTYTASSVADLIADINAANAAGGSNTIALVAGTTFQLTTVNNSTDGATGLPVIAASDNLTIIGNGDTLARSTASGTPAFRLIDVAAGASLTLSNLTLQGGLALGAGVSAEGGAIYNQGTLLLNGVTVQNNIAEGNSPLSPAQSAAGGGIYSGGSLTLQGCTIQNNQAVGQAGFDGYFNPGGNGGNGLGGGLYVAGGTATLNNVTLYSNTAQGGDGGNGGPTFTERRQKNGTPGGNGGNGLGGGLYVAGATVTLTTTTVAHNTALGGNGGSGAYGAGSGNPGLGEGGGLYIDPAALVCLDAFTQANVSHNKASTSGNDIYGSYTICP